MRDSWDLRDLRTLRDPQGTHQTLDARRLKSGAGPAPHRVERHIRRAGDENVICAADCFCVGGGGAAIHFFLGGWFCYKFRFRSPLSRSSPRPYLLRPYLLRPYLLRPYLLRPYLLRPHLPLHYLPRPISSALISPVLIPPPLSPPFSPLFPYLLRSHLSALIPLPHPPPSFLHSHPLARITPARIPPSSPYPSSPSQKYNT